MGTPNKEAALRAGCAPKCDERGTCPPGIGPRKEREKTREQIKDYIIIMLGGPTLKLELDEQALDMAVDMALDVFEDYCPRDYFDYYTFNIIPGKSVYKMPPEVGIIRNVFYRQVPYTGLAAGSYDLDGVVPLDYFYGGMGATASGGGLMNPQYPVWGHMGEWTLYKQYEQMYSNITGNKGGWEWISDHQHIKIYPANGGFCGGGGSVSVHYLQACKDWKKATQAMKEGALSYAKEILGQIRGKYTGTYGPANSGMQLNGEALLTQAATERQKWFTDLIDKFGDLPPITMA